MSTASSMDGLNLPLIGQGAALESLERAVLLDLDLDGLILGAAPMTGQGAALESLERATLLDLDGDPLESQARVVLLGLHGVLLLLGSALVSQERASQERVLNADLLLGDLLDGKLLLLGAVLESQASQDLADLDGDPLESQASLDQADLDGLMMTGPLMSGNLPHGATALESLERVILVPWKK